MLGKSAQVPFQDWLPDAMEGPTPASALIHAATMVAAGTVVLAGLHPALAQAEVARWVLGIATSVTMSACGPARHGAERPQTAARVVDGQPGRHHAVRAGCCSGDPRAAAR
ncbi:MAG: hypothetical protein IPM00_15635 [Tetrasphaera sp.]|nr:hypothetical protein [Tetrasphaera sp.]